MKTEAVRILVIRGGAIGDFILTLPAIGALRERWPDAHIEIMGYSQIVELAAGRYYAQKTRSIEYGPLSGFFAADGELDKELAAYFASFQLVVSYLYDPDRIFETNLRRAGVRHLVAGTAKPTQLHAAAHFAKPLESLAIYVESPQPRVYPSESDLEFGRQFWGVSSGLRCAVHCGSGSPQKNWPARSFAEVCTWLRRTRECTLAVIWGEADEAAASELLSLLCPYQPRLARHRRLTQLAGILKCAHLYLGNDSGITHLAAAVGTPTIAFWGPTSSPLWRPLGGRVRVIPFAEATQETVHRAVESILGESAPQTNNS